MKQNSFKEFKNLPHRKILSIDLKCFYASVECVDRGLDPFNTPLIVADRERGEGTIVLAVSPYLKAKGFPSRLRVYELPETEHIIFAQPRMQHYIDISAEVVGIFLEYVDQEDLHVYSIDESFLDVTGYKEVEKYGAKRYARRIMKDIKSRLGLTVTVGIGENIFMAKAAMDIEAKHRQDYLASWTYQDIPNKLWPLTPLSEMWGIGQRLEKRLNKLGFFKIGDIASSDRDYFKTNLGMIGEEIFNHSYGVDYAEIRKKYIPENKSLSVGQVLFEDYDPSDAREVIKEMVEELVFRLHKEQLLTQFLSVYIGYTKTIGGGYHGTTRLEQAIDDEIQLKEAFVDIFDKNKENKKIRKLNISAGDLSDKSNFQLNLLIVDTKSSCEANLIKVLNEVKSQFGYDLITKSTSAQMKSTFKYRSKLVGGHHK